VLKALGCETLVITNSCGGMNPDMPAGSIVVTSDHINLMGDNPLIGENDDTLGPASRHERALFAPAHRAGGARRARAHDSAPARVFVAVTGPNLETAAEYRFLRWIGADVVGMSLVPENIAAVHGGQRVLSFNVITDECLPDNLHPVDIPQILAVAGRTAPVLSRLVTEVIRRLDTAA
jgi:purine-nucleoside phosphorylase